MMSYPRPLNQIRQFFQSRQWCHWLAVVGMLSMTGCYSMAPAWQLRQAQLKTYQVYRQGQMTTAQLQQMEQTAAQSANEAQQLAAHRDQLIGERDQLASERQMFEQSLSVANQRLANLNAERVELHDQYQNLVSSLPAPGNPLNGSASGRFQDLASKYPEFEFDPTTGVSKFNGELLFPSGSDAIQPEGRSLLVEFADIMNSADAQQFNILVVGHTDDEAIVQAATRARHPTNWELSAHRATAVVKELAHLGIAEPRMGVAGYNKYQPSVANVNDSARQQNRRVEIFILAPDAAVAGRDINTVQ